MKTGNQIGGYTQSMFSATSYLWITKHKRVQTGLASNLFLLFFHANGKPRSSTFNNCATQILNTTFLEEDNAPLDSKPQNLAAPLFHITFIVCDENQGSLAIQMELKVSIQLFLLALI